MEFPLLFGMTEIKQRCDLLSFVIHVHKKMIIIKNIKFLTRLTCISVYGLGTNFVFSTTPPFNPKVESPCLINRFYVHFIL